MSSPRPPNPASTTQANADPPAQDADIDAEMEDQTQEATSSTVQNPSSGTLEGESSTQQQTDPQQATGASAFSHQNRKDVSLREFLSRMDDYAPIVRISIFPLPL